MHRSLLHLINSYRNHIRLIQKNICRHQHRIGKKSGIDIVCMLCRLILKLGHTVQFTHIGKTVKNPCQLCMSGNMGLIIETVFLRIQSCCNVNHQQISRSLAKGCRILANRNGMHVNHAVKALILVAQSHPILHGSQVIAKSQISCSLHSAEQYFFFIYHNL